MSIWEKAKKADSNYSVASWAPAMLQFAFPASFAAASAWAASYRDWIWGTYGMFGALSIALLVFVVLSLAVYISGVGVASWRNVLASRAASNAALSKISISNNPSAARNVDKVQLVPSENEMCLVVTPGRGGATVEMFVDVSSWQPSLMPSSWSKYERFYLGEARLRSANVKFSVPVMGRGPEGVPGWIWKILKPNGEPSGTSPWFVYGRLRATFLFVDNAGAEEKFSMLLLRPQATSQDHPIVVTAEEVAPVQED